MARPGTVERTFDLGFKTDSPRGALPKGAVYRMKDYIPQRGAPARKRGGWSYASDDLSGYSSADHMTGVAWAPFPGYQHPIAVSEAGKVYELTLFGGVSSYLGSTGFAALTHRPFWHNDRMILLQALGSAAADPYKITSSGGVSTLAPVGGTPPQASVGWSWGDYLALANCTIGGTLYPNRIRWCDVGTPDLWTTSTSLWDMPEEIVAGVSMRSFQMVWGYSNTWILTGDTPPPGGNMARRTLYAGNGCMDGLTVAQYREYAIWANSSGVYKSDGSTLTDLTARGGISQYWNDEIAGNFNHFQGYRATAGVWNGHYFITVYQPYVNYLGTGVTVRIGKTLVCDLENDIWFEMTNFQSAMYATRSAGPGSALVKGFEEMFFANFDTPHVCSVSSCWDPSNANESDADGTDVLPEIETDFYPIGSSSLKRIRRAYVTHDTRAYADTPTQRVSAVFSPESTSYVTLTPDLVATTEIERKPVRVNKRALGIGLKIAQIGSSSDTRLYGIDIEGHPVERSR